MGKAVKTVVDLYMHDGTSVDAGPPVQSQGTCVRTNAIDPDEFSAEFAHVIAEQFGIAKENIVYLRTWTEQAFEIMCKLRGYKAEQVQEQRVLWTGHFSPWQSWQVGGTGIAEAEGLPDTKQDRELLESSLAFALGGPDIELQKRLVKAIGVGRAKEIASETGNEEWLADEVLSSS